MKKEYGYLEKFESISTTEKSEVTFKINKMLHEVGMNGGISVAVQSMTPKVLEAVGRKNISVEKLRYQLDWYRQNGMGTYTDLNALRKLLFIRMTGTHILKKSMTEIIRNRQQRK